MNIIITLAILMILAWFIFVFRWNISRIEKNILKSTEKKNNSKSIVYKQNSTNHMLVGATRIIGEATACKHICYDTCGTDETPFNILTNGTNIVYCASCDFAYRCESFNMNMGPSAGPSAAQYIASSNILHNMETFYVYFSSACKRVYGEDFSSLDKKILEIGSGIGLFMAVARRHGWVPTGIELWKQWRDYGKKAFQVDIRSTSIPELAKDFPTESFDAITSSQVMEHVADPHSTFRVLYSLLKPTGMLFSCVPNAADDLVLNEIREQKKISGFVNTYANILHVSHWTQLSIEVALKHARFSNVQTFIHGEHMWELCFYATK